MISVLLRGMIKDNIKGLLLGIFVVIALLVCCMALDSADEISNINESSLPHNIPKGTIVMNNSSIVAVNESASVIVVKHNDVIHTIKPKYHTITITGKPSCSRCARNHIPYRWFTRSYVNYCPNCHRYGTLGNKHKYGSRYEQEISCFHCDSDFCVYDGHEKYSWSNKYLRRA